MWSLSLNRSVVVRNFEYFSVEVCSAEKKTNNHFSWPLVHFSVVIILLLFIFLFPYRTHFVCKIETTWRYSNEAGFSRNLSAWGTRRNENRIIIHYFGKKIEIREDCLIAGYKKSPLSLSIRLVALTDTGRYNSPAIRIIIRSLFQRKPHTIGGFCFECYLAVRSGAKLWCQLINSIAMYVNLSGCSQNMSSSYLRTKARTKRSHCCMAPRKPHAWGWFLKKKNVTGWAIFHQLASFCQVSVLPFSNIHKWYMLGK